MPEARRLLDIVFIVRRQDVHRIPYSVHEAVSRCYQTDMARDRQGSIRGDGGGAAARSGSADGRVRTPTQ